jgi:PBP1b-binding outer membrane lipoprotein LpoB
MEALKRSAAALLVAMGLSACSSGDHDQTTPDASVTEPDPEVDAGQLDPDASIPSTDPVPLSLWVDDLIDHYTTDDALPDTVDDKNISDDTDEASFDKYLPK